MGRFYAKKLKGFTLLEILVAMILLGIGIATLAGIFVAGRYFLRQAENRSNAMSVVSTHLTEFTSASYSGLLDFLNDPGHHSLCAGRNCGACDNPVANFLQCQAVWDTEDNVNWRAEVNRLAAPTGCVAPNLCIPYMEVIVSGQYDEEDIRGNAAEKQVRLRNLVSYPMIHLQRYEIEPTDPTHPACPLVTTALPETLAHFNAGNSTGLGPGTGSSTITINYPVTKNLFVIYNIAIDVVANANPITATDTILTACRLNVDASGNPSNTGTATLWSVHTRTPVLTQPLISNAITINNVPPGQFTFDIRWFKNCEGNLDRGTITLRHAEIIVVAFEQ
jgi:prepilin-type N-terminal cleavage/methylation domain-containing protein